MARVAVVAMCNRYALRQPWLSKCAGTWPDRLLPSARRYLVSDGSLSAEETERFHQLTGFEPVATESIDSELAALLANHSAIREMRTRCVFYRRIFDFSLRFSEFSHVLNVDTDIALAREISLPEQLPGFAYCVDDCPGYSSAASIAFRERMVTGLNAGFLLFQPQDVLNNLDFLEKVTAKYILRGRTAWWAEQTLWSLIAGSLATSCAVFSPKSVAIVSGLRKRSLEDIQNSRTRYFSRTRKIEDIDEIKRIAGNASVIHYAGPGKPWIDKLDFEMHDDAEEVYPSIHAIGLDSPPAFPFSEKLKLATRLLLQNRAF